MNHVADKNETARIKKSKPWSNYINPTSVQEIPADHKIV